MHKSRVVLGCMALVLTLALLIPLVGCGGGGPAVPCKISSVSGDVQVLRSGSADSIKATNGMELAAGDTITTGDNGSTNLTFFDGSVMEIKANSEILVNELSTASTGSTTVSLKETVGSTINRIGKLVDSSSRYEVDTPAAVAVVRGTVFDLLVQQNGTTTVKAEQDSVSFTASGVTVTVNQGFQSSASVGGTPSTPIVIVTPTATQAHTPTSTQAHTPTPAKTPTATPTSTSGQTLADIYGQSHYTGDVQYDMVITAGGVSQQMVYKVSMKSWASSNTKVRYDIPAAYPGGFTYVILWDSSTRTQYTWYPDQNIACQVPTGQGQDNPAENTDQIIPTYLGTDTIDGKLCDVYQYTFQGSSAKVWIWKEKWFPIRMETTTASGTSIMEYQNIVFGTLSDSLFQLPSSVQMQPYPCYPMPSIPSYPYST
jgi:outer membrane lipoprotein-sorting protein